MGRATGQKIRITRAALSRVSGGFTQAHFSQLNFRATFTISLSKEQKLMPLNER